MAYFLSPVGNSQQIDTNGRPLNGGKIYSYLAGSSTPAATFTGQSGATQQANPIILNALGLPDSPVWLSGGVPVKLVIQDAAGVTLRTVDSISGINDTTTSPTEWVDSGLLATYLNAASFSVSGDQVGVLQVARRLRTQNTAGRAYSTILTSVYAAGITTVTLANDSLPLDAGLSSVAYGLLAPQNKSIAVVGIVSQAAGVPTGAVVESGSNSNGAYVRWADGTQICQRTGGLLTFSNSSNLTCDWSYPAAFISPPAISSNLEGVTLPTTKNISAITAWARTATTANVSVLSPSLFVDGDQNGQYLDNTAIGRWF